MVISPRGIVKLSLPQPSEKSALDELALGPNAARVSFERFDELVSRIREYFKGKQVDFEDKLDTSDGTVFQRSVWSTCRTIPYGQTRTYAWIAEQIGKPRASRAVGSALGKNPIPIIVPCHRVLASDGGLGGFKGGISAKKLLLKLEGIELKTEK
jgi:methylated-DNA-[protein]-cysteine S-methyltransferase